MLAKALRLIKLAHFKNIHEHVFNVPVKIANGKISSVNERIIELPLIHRYLVDFPAGKRILDFGCARSLLPITLSALGYDVIGVDLRHCDFIHPNFTFHKGDIQFFETQPVDCIIAVSTLEHVGIGAYNEKADDRALPKVIDKLYELVVENGWLLLTVPVGRPSQDGFQRIFHPNVLLNLMASHGFAVEQQDYFTRSDETTWHNVDVNELKEGSYRSGVSSIVCMKCIKV